MNLLAILDTVIRIPLRQDKAFWQVCRCSYSAVLSEQLHRTHTKVSKLRRDSNPRSADTLSILVVSDARDF